MMTNIRIRPARSGDWAQLETLQLGALPWNGSALEFYKQLGFTPPSTSRRTVHLVREIA